MKSVLLLGRVAIFLVLSVTLPAPSYAQDQKGHGVVDPRDPALAPRPALAPVMRTPRTNAFLKLHTIPSSIPGKTEWFIDQGLGLPLASPGNREQAKLEAARVAVAAARAGLGTAPRSTPTVDPSVAPHEALNAKHERLRLAQPGAVPLDPALSGLPASLVSRQKQGLAKPTVRELEKLKATATSPVTPDAKKETER